MSFTRKLDKLSYRYNIGSKQTSTCQRFRLYFHPVLSFVEHINEASLAASRNLRSITRNYKNFTNLLALKILYFMFVLSKLKTIRKS